MHSSTRSAYARASCEYQTKYGLTAKRAAATRAARCEKRSRAAAYAAGTAASPNSAESDLSPASCHPKTRSQSQART